MMNNADVLRVTLKSTFAGQQCNNVFYYKGFGVAGVNFYQGFAALWEPTMMSPLVALANEAVFFSSAVVENITNGIDYYEFGISGAGQTEGEYISAFAAYSFKLIVPSKLTRPGFKRFPGVSVSTVNNGQIAISPTLENDIEDVLIAQVEVTDDGDSMICYPVVVGRTPTGDYDLARVQNIVGAALMPQLSTQNSRKIGHGN